MRALIPYPNTMGQTLYQVMSEPNFCNGTRSKRTTFFVIRKSFCPTAWMTSMTVAKLAKVSKNKGRNVEE
jgi:hypothetical protein